MSSALIEIYFRSGEHYTFIGDEAEKLWIAIDSNSIAPIHAMWGLPPLAEIVFMNDSIEHSVWYANGRP